ncbi:MAG TPA: hypothetical protein VHB21_12440 [Minicystis sp.]|nr:hypothetical protein [Minicystis sp.]
MNAERLRLALFAAALVSLVACASNPPAMQPGYLDAKAKLQRCCDEVDAAARRPGVRADAPEGWAAASRACKERLDDFDNDLPGAMKAVQKAAGSQELAGDAPDCKR